MSITTCYRDGEAPDHLIDVMDPDDYDAHFHQFMNQEHERYEFQQEGDQTGEPKGGPVSEMVDEDVKDAESANSPSFLRPQNMPIESAVANCPDSRIGRRLGENSRPRGEAGTSPGLDLCNDGDFNPGSAAHQDQTFRGCKGEQQGNALPLKSVPVPVMFSTDTMSSAQASPPNSNDIPYDGAASSPGGPLLPLPLPTVQSSQTPVKNLTVELLPAELIEQGSTRAVTPDLDDEVNSELEQNKELAQLIHQIKTMSLEATYFKEKQSRQIYETQILRSQEKVIEILEAQFGEKRVYPHKKYLTRLWKQYMMPAHSEFVDFELTTFKEIYCLNDEFSFDADQFFNHIYYMVVDEEQDAKFPEDTGGRIFHMINHENKDFIHLNDIIQFMHIRAFDEIGEFQDLFREFLKNITPEKKSRNPA